MFLRRDMKTQRDAWTEAYLDSGKRKWLFGFKPTAIVNLMLKYSQNFGKNKFHRVIDVGCGSGRNTLALAKLGFEAYGMDFVEPAILELKNKAQREHLKINVIVHDITQPWPYPDDFFDIAIINVVLDSIDHAKRFFVAKELARVMRKRGLLFVYEPSYKDGYYGQYVDFHKNNFEFICPDDGIKREIFTKEKLT
jgi:SAM-dependent methyltransferase